MGNIWIDMTTKPILVGIYLNLLRFWQGILKLIENRFRFADYPTYLMEIRSSPPRTHTHIHSYTRLNDEIIKIPFCYFNLGFSNFNFTCLVCLTQHIRRFHYTTIPPFPLIRNCNFLSLSHGVRSRTIIYCSQTTIAHCHQPTRADVCTPRVRLMHEGCISRTSGRTSPSHITTVPQWGLALLLHSTSFLHLPFF